MKKVLLMVCLTVALLLPSKLNGQMSTSTLATPFSFSVVGGYSWLSGVVGGELQYGKLGIEGGWMPTSMPLSGTRVDSWGIAATFYTLPTGIEGTSYYFSGGMASAGYQYEDTWGGEYTEPVIILMAGSKYDVGGVFFKGGIGYGWNEEMGTFAFELTLGFKLFGN
jgi:hypothetical protein